MLISIILPIFNVEDYLVECLESVLKKLKNGYEVILVNDGSTDRSPQIIEHYKAQYPELIVINRNNGGLSAARNSGLEVASGKYLLFVDSDDVLDMDVLENLLLDAENNIADIAVADYYEFEHPEQKKYRYDKAIITDPLVTEEDRLEKLFTIDVSFAVWNKMYRADFLKQNNLVFLPGYWYEDLDFVFRAFYYSTKIVKTSGPLIGYRQRRGSITNSISLKALDKMEIMDKIAIFLKNENKFEQYEEMYKILYLKMMFSIIYACVKLTGDSKTSNEIIKRLFNMDYLQKIKKSHLLYRYKMKPNERVFFSLIKIGLINPLTLSLLSKSSNTLK